MSGGTRSEIAAPNRLAPLTDSYETAFTDGYVQGVRDAAAWSVQSAVRFERLAIGLEKLAADLARQAREEVANAQHRWAENADLRNPVQTDRLVEAAWAHLNGAPVAPSSPPTAPSSPPKAPAQPRHRRRQVKGTSRPASSPAQDLDWSEPLPAAAGDGERRTQEEQMVRAAGRAWRA